MKIKNIANSVEQNEIKSSKYNKCYYDSAEIVEIRKLSDVLTDSEHQYVVKEKCTPEQARAKLKRKVKGLRCTDSAYIKKLCEAEIKLCYFPIYYMRIDCYKYRVGYESACRSSVRDFGRAGKRGHYPDLFCVDAPKNSKFFDLNGREGDNARKAEYADLEILGSQDMKKVITFKEFKPEENREVYSAEYQVLQTVYYPIWVVVVECEEKEIYTYISDCGDEVNASIAYNQTMLEDVTRKVRRPRRFFWALSDVKFFWWSWFVVAAICFLFGIAFNADKIVDGVVIDSLKPFISSAVVSILLHWIIYSLALKQIGVYSDTNPLIDGVEIGAIRAEFWRILFVISMSVFPVVITAFIITYDKA